MIIIRTPYRIPLAGGGTDLDFYYKKKGGLFISGTFNQYIFVSLLQRPIDSKISIQTFNTQILTDVHKVKNKIVRETLNYFKIKKKIQIGTFSTLPTSSGLGSSSSLTVGLVNGILKLLNNKKKNKKEIAKIAFKIERMRLGIKGGWQDQIMASFGGLNKVRIKKNGQFEVQKINIKKTILKKIEKYFFLIYTDKTRNSSKIINSQKKNLINTIDIYDRIKNLVIEFEKALKKGNAIQIGKIFNEQWNLKKKLSSNISNSKINKFYEKLMLSKNFVGGKLIGAGGGGFFLMVSKNPNKTISFLKKKKLNYLKLRFTSSGTSQIVNSNV